MITLENHLDSSSAAADVSAAITEDVCFLVRLVGIAGGLKRPRGGWYGLPARNSEAVAASTSTFFTSFSRETCRSLKRENLNLLSDLLVAISPCDPAPALISLGKKTNTLHFSARFMLQTQTGSGLLVYMSHEKTPFALFASPLVVRNVNFLELAH
jgi:hypothetical protein